MAINFTQTDTFTADTNTYCSGRTIRNNSMNDATDGGSAGSTPISTSCFASDSLVVCNKFKCVVASGLTWASGTWTWRINITTANMNLTLEEVYICRVNSSDVNQATIGSVTALAVSLGSTGVKSGTISGSAQTPSVGDYVSVVFVYSNGAMSAQTFQYTPNQNIDSPFTTAPSTNLLPFCISPQPTR